MATAEKARREVKKWVEVDVQEDVFTLTLSKAEAETLAEITYRHVSGSSKGPRLHSDAIHDALRDAGVDESAIIGLGSGGVHFGEYPSKAVDDSPLKVGDRVRVTSVNHNGKAGILLEIDPDDDDLPYFVDLDDSDNPRWATSVERVSD